jgi:hypothetical protein
MQKNATLGVEFSNHQWVENSGEAIGRFPGKAPDNNN